MFAALKEEKRAALFGVIQTGDPDVETSLGFCRRLLSAGLDALVLSVPCRMPMLSSPPVVRSHARALAAGTTYTDALKIIRTLRDEGCDKPIVMAVYVSVLFKVTVSVFAKAAAAAGADAFIVEGCPADRSSELTPQLRRHGMRRIRIIPVGARITRSRQMASPEGDITALYLHGDAEAAAGPIADLRAVSSLPICLGYGAASPAEVARDAARVDGVFLGAAFTEMIEKDGAAAIDGMERLVVECLPALSKKQ